MNLRKLKQMAADLPRDLERKDGTETPEQSLLREMKEARTQLVEAVKAKADLSVVRSLQAQVDAIDVRLAERHVSDVRGDRPDVKKMFEENDSIQRLMRDRKGTGVIEIPTSMLERKTTIDSGAVGSATSGVLTIDRTPGIVQEARQALTIRDVLTARPTAMQIIDFVKVSQAPVRASVQTEDQVKLENAVTFTTGTARVQVLATWIPASRQVLDDMVELSGYLQTALPYYVNLNEEAQLLTGSNTGNDLNGLITQATPYNTALNTLSPGWQRIDQIGHAIQQIQIAKEITPTFIVLHPTDFWAIRLTKDAQARYISNTMDVFWGLQPVVTTSIGQGTFLVGSGNPAAAEIRDRMTMTVEISTEHSDYFVRNLVAIRAEKRMTLAVYRTGSYVTGTFTTSP